MKDTILSPLQSIEDTGLSQAIVEELALKNLYSKGEMLLPALAKELKLNISIVDQIFQRLRKEKLIEVKGMMGNFHLLAVTSLGRERAIELLARNQYTGPTPVTLKTYVDVVNKQSVRNIQITPADVRNAFNHLVISDSTLDQLGMSINSGDSMFLYGPSGTGKTSIAESIQKAYQDSVYIPYAIAIDGQIITVFDSAIHSPLEDEASAKETDARFIKCERPVVITGGDLTIDMLDLQFDTFSKTYTAPLQVKANNGLLIIDDFGRQRMSPMELLNRWIVPLDRHIDYLSLAGGKKFETPFDMLVIFSSNLQPADLADDAFLRRIHNKILIDEVTAEQFKEITRRMCSSKEVVFDEVSIDHFTDVIRNELKESFRPSYPRDIVRQICSAAKYTGDAPVLNSGTIKIACDNYFL